MSPVKKKEKDGERFQSNHYVNQWSAKCSPQPVFVEILSMFSGTEEGRKGRRREGTSQEEYATEKLYGP